MKRRYSFKQLNSLWSHKPSSITIKVNLAQSSETAFLKKMMDEICLDADLAESTSEYALILCRGVVRLYKIGVPVDAIKQHQQIWGKILFLGKDILQNSKPFSDLFYLGLLIEIKVTSKWREPSFFKFLVNALKTVACDLKFMSSKVKEKLIVLFKEKSLELYRFYFININDSLC